MINRRKFIYSTSLGLLSLSLFPSPTILAELDERANVTSNKDLNSRLLRASQIRKKGKLRRAKHLYYKIIEDYPKDIRAYDGLRKTFLTGGKNELEILKIYELAYANHPEIPEIKARLASEYIRIALGNKKILNQINNHDKLLKNAKKIFKFLAENYPNREEYKAQLQKVRKKIRAQADEIDARSNVLLKEERSKRRKKYRQRFKSASIEEIVEKLGELLKKPKNDFRDKHIKELYQILIRRLNKIEEFDRAYEYAKEFYEFNNYDTTALFLVYKFAKKTEKYNELVLIAENNHTLKNNFWSNLSRFDAYFLMYRKGHSYDLIKLDEVLNEIERMIQLPQHNQEFYLRKIKITIRKKEYREAKELLLSFGERIIATNNLHNVLLFLTLVTQYYKKIGKRNLALQIINLALNNKTTITEDDSLYKICSNILADAKFENEHHIKRLNRIKTKLLTNLKES
ncbi:hypothetical protein GO491_01125 [Flavobacteriaceae bacterium Ap0902]|nr:hypothetical protein [Flavobacteriaceae bacterium Ap0902]